jgi:hypothetical protein
MKLILIAVFVINGCVPALYCQVERSNALPSYKVRSIAHEGYYKEPSGAAGYLPGQFPVASFRIIFGLNDLKPTAWDGEVVPRVEQPLAVEADHFRDYQYEHKGWSKGIISIKRPDPTLPNDYLKGKTAWVCSTRESPLSGPTTEWHDYGQINDIQGHAALQPIIVQPSVLVHLGCNCLDMPVHIKTVRGEFDFIPRQILSHRDGYFLNRDVKVEAVPPEQAVAPERLGQQDFPSVLSSKSGKLWVAWQEYDGVADQLMVRGGTGKSWGQVSILAKNADVFRTVLAEDAEHRIWVVWSMQVNRRWDLYARFFDGSRWSNQERLTYSKATKNIYHEMATDSDGHMWLVWQCTQHGYSQIYAEHFDGKEWSKGEQISSGHSASGDNWWPSVAAGPKGSLAVVWDGYASGNYDVYLRRHAEGVWGKEEVVAGTARFEAHPTVAIDNNDKIWVAWDESGVNWGKDVGFLIGQKGTPLHNSRSVGLLCFDGDKRLAPQEDIRQVLKLGDFWELPHLQLDAQGKPWLFVRHLVMREPDTPLEGPINLALWEIWATQYDGEHWTKPMYLPHSSGRNDMMLTSTLASNGEVWAIWATDQRDTKDYQPQQQQVRLGEFGQIAPEHSLSLKPYRSIEPENSVPLNPNEAEQVRRIRDYRIHINEKTYSIYRGDLHRHTDISVDGNNDGSLLDAYRYARDAASLDFLGVTNHTDDIWDKYNWWRTQKIADLFNIDNSFVDLYSYERSIEWPNGHRNIFFIKRGAPILPIGAFEARAGYVGSGTLYAYLHRYGGFSIPHTTGRTSGTDWRDNDPAVESVMEIYQGMRDSYEYPGSPRPFKLFSSPDSSKPIPRASSAMNSPSFKPLGFAWNALAKGYKLGFIASSDHISTHISYACVIAEDLTRESLVDAIKHRRTYAATDNIILDIKYEGSDGQHLMGSIFESKTPVRIKANIVGTGNILQIDVIHNNAIVRTYKPNRPDAIIEYVDQESSKEANNYYYVRVIQKNGEMAWSSPVWVTYTK